MKSISFSRSLESISREEVTKVIKGVTILNKMILITLLSSLIIIMDNKDTSKLSVQMLTKTKIKVLTRNQKASPRRDVHTLLKMIMMIQQVVNHKKEVKKQPCVSCKIHGWDVTCHGWL